MKRSSAATWVCAGDPLSILMWAILIAIVITGLWIGSMIFSVEHIIRLRNALRAKRANVEELCWKPGNVPAQFILETRVPPPIFEEVIRRLDPDRRTSDWQRALRIAEHLTVHAQDRGPIRRDMVTTYREIQAGYGYCADFVKVFLGLCHAAGLFARQWAFSFNGFGGFGHTFVEIFDRAEDRWLFLDVFNNIHARDIVTDVPLGALEFWDALRHTPNSFRIAPNGRGRLGYPIEQKLLAYFRRGLREWYLVCGNAVFSYEASALVRWSSSVSAPLAQIAADFLGRHPPIQVLTTADNEPEVARLLSLKRTFHVALSIGAALLVMLIFQLPQVGWWIGGGA